MRILVNLDLGFRSDRPRTRRLGPQNCSRLQWVDSVAISKPVESEGKNEWAG